MSLLRELKRRNVFRVGIAYAVASWLLLQIADVLIDNIGAPEWVFPTLLMVLGIGFPLALLFAWAFELTPEGIKRESEIDRSESTTHRSGGALNMAVIAMLVMIAVYFIWESRFKASSGAPGKPVAEIAGSDERIAAPARADAGAVPGGPGTAASTVASAPTLDANAIAVLPFANRSNVEEDLFFTDGIHDDLLTQLAKIDALKVISRTSVMGYRDTTKRIPEIAAELGVGVVLEGGVQRAGNRVRINAQLIDVNTDEHLWAETFDREMTIENIFDIQSEITGQIVTAIKGELSDSEREAIAERPTDSLEAWEAFLQSRAIIAEPEYQAQKYLRAEKFIVQAVEADPDFAEAWVDYASIILNGIWIGHDDTPEQRQRTRNMIARARALAPDNPDVKRIEAEYEYRVNLDYARALSLLNEARNLAPGNVRVYEDLGATLRRLGRWEESVAAFEQALALDPLNAFIASTLVETLWMMNEIDRMSAMIDRWLPRAPDSPFLINMKARSLVLKNGDLPAAQRLLRDARSNGKRGSGFADAWVASLGRDWDELIQLQGQEGFNSGLPVFGRSASFMLGQSHAQAGQMETANDYFRRYTESSDPDALISVPAKAFMKANLAVAHAWLGDEQQARDLAEQATTLLSAEQDHVFGNQIEGMSLWVIAYLGDRDRALEGIAAKLDDPGGFNRWDLYLSPDWDFFRDDPRFNDLVRPDGVEPSAFRPIGEKS